MLPSTSSEANGLRVGVLVVAYNAATTLAQTLDRLPSSFAATLDHILVCDDASHDETYEVGLDYQASSPLPVTVIKHPRNLGYGGNQKAGYHWAMEHGLDVVVLLHGDGQYAPEVIETVVAPLLRHEADAVFGSRMLVPGGARAGGMPLYKLVGNRILTTMQNALTGLRLSEWHSGYRAYRMDALRDLDIDSYSDGFDFDTEIILGLHAAGKAITEVPIPTYYGDEICYVNGLRYARDVTRDVVRYRTQRIGFGGTDLTSSNADSYELKHSPHSSHGRLLAWLDDREPCRVLDVGCSDGKFGALAQKLGHRVTGLDITKHEGVGDRVDEFFEADLNSGVPPEVGTFDVIVAGDVLEHVVEPARLLADLATHLAPGGEILVSVPNFAHWYPRGRTALGLFDYDQRGPLDIGHVRFFTRRSFEKLLRGTGMRITERQVVGTPLDVLGRGGGSPHRALELLARGDRLLTRLWPTLFGYQFLYRLESV